jgi:uncharacterized protein
MVQAFTQTYGPWALIAGASEGLGAAFAEQLAGRGINLLLAARRAGRLAELAQQLEARWHVQVQTCAIDLAEPGAALELAQLAAGLDVGLLVYNAAFSAVGLFLERPLEDHLREVETNIRAPLALSYAFGQRLVARGRGGILLMSSLSAQQGSAYIANYAATKAYNQLLGEGLWEEWRQRGVDTLVCLAGAIATPNYTASQPGEGAGVARRAMAPEQVAREAIAALGKQPLVVPGGINRLASLVMRALPRRVAIQMMGRILSAMYGVN